MNYNQRLQKNNTDLEELNRLIQELPVAKIEQEKVVIPTTKEQIILPDDNTKTLSKVTIAPGLDTKDATALPEDIALGKTAYVNNIKISGTTINGDLDYWGRKNPEIKEYQKIIYLTPNKSSEIISNFFISDGEVIIENSHPEIATVIFSQETSNLIFTSGSIFGENKITFYTKETKNYKKSPSVEIIVKYLESVVVL